MFEIENPTEADKGLQSLQSLELEILKELDRICRKHDIHYSLGGGSCLGQVRHGGFIPWDDDIDIDMTTENYRRFLAAAETELDDKKFFLRTNKNDPKHLRSMSRLELKYTYLGQPDWDNIKVHPGIFVDLCELAYLPNNPRKRKRVATKLFYIRCTQNYKSFKRYAKKSPQGMRPLIRIGAKVLPNSFLLSWEERLKNITNGQHTDWVLDNAIINGNYGGYPAACVDEYMDVEFEGIRVMSKKDTDSFLKILYGENYMEWLPPNKRISHHRWTKFDFGIYENQLSLSENYKDYLLVTYNMTQLRQMKKVSLDVAEALHEVCERHGLSYCVVGQDALYSEYGVDEAGELWKKPLAVAMPRPDYEELICNYSGEFDGRYFLQEHRTQCTYYQPYARLRLNNTYIRENKYPGVVEDAMHSGFFINIYPIDASSAQLQQALKSIRKIRKMDSWLMLKVRKRTFDSWCKARIKEKIKLVLLKFCSLEDLFQKAQDARLCWMTESEGYYFSPEGLDIDLTCFDKEVFEAREKRNYFGHELFFLPVDRAAESHMLASYNKGFERNKSKVEELAYIKSKNYCFYYDKVASLNKLSINNIKKSFDRCYLEFYDTEDYQLSVWRYDEHSDRFLTNDEIFG